MKISVVMPALNESKNIQAAINNSLQSLHDYEIDGEIIVIDDGSTDGTDVLIREEMKKSKQIKMVKHETPRGIGASFWDGFDIADGDIITWIPGDNENDPWEIFRYYRLLEHVDIIIPFIFNKEVRSLFRNTLSYIYRLIINTTFFVNFNYTNGTILFRKSILKEMNHRSNGFFVHTDILIRAVKKGYLFAEVPYRLGLRKEGVSKAISFPSLKNVTKGYLRLVRDHYFQNQRKVRSFAQDSLTAKRRNSQK